MTTKTQKIAELKAQYPTLSKGINNQVVELNAEEYEALIVKWADIELANEAEEAAEAQKVVDREAQKQQDEADAIAKAALLERLGITEAEAKLLVK
jgi:ribosomal 30S subunit maturation factor RimM